MCIICGRSKNTLGRWDDRNVRSPTLLPAALFLSRSLRSISTGPKCSWRYQMFITVNINPLTPNDLYMSRTALLTSKRCILYIYSTNRGTEYFKHALHSPFFSLQNAVCFIMLTSLVPVLFTFYIQSVLKLKKNNSGAKGLMWWTEWLGERRKL